MYSRSPVKSIALRRIFVSLTIQTKESVFFGDALGVCVCVVASLYFLKIVFRLRVARVCG